jgi:hypothetical protein
MTTMKAHTAGHVSPKQIAMLRDYQRDGEPTDLHDFGAHGLGWGNRERVITALIRKGLIDAYQVITEAGIAVLAKAEARSNG